MTGNSVGTSGLIIFLRFPEEGKVKSRLSHTLGDEKALEIYRELTRLTLRLASNVSIPTYLFYTGGLPAEKDRNNAFEYLEQTEGDLGEKMTHAFDYVLQYHQKAIIIGSDCPDIGTEEINQCIQLLDDQDIVIGPTTDGGYYLLGCKKLYPSIFKSIDWSTSSVLSQTINKIEQQGNSCILLRTHSDIDTEEDWNRFKTRS